MADEGFSDEDNQFVGHEPPNRANGGIIQNGQIPHDLAENVNAGPDLLMGDEDSMDLDLMVAHELQEKFLNEEYMMLERDLIHGGREFVAPQEIMDQDQRQPSIVPDVENNKPEELDFTVDNVVLDLDAHVGAHSGLIKILRLQHVAKHCPQLRVDALKLILKHVKSSSDTNTYTKTYEELKNAIQSGLKSEDGDATLPRFEEEWVRETNTRFLARLDHLENDLKNYKTNSIKESIRRGYDEIGGHHLDAGDANNALKSFIKGREYCEGARDEAQSLANRLKACVYLRYFPNANELITQMRDLEPKVGLTGDAKPSATPAAQDRKLEINWNLIRASLGLHYLKIKDYRTAADIFVSLSPEFCDFPSVIVGRDIALYGALCAVATYDRKSLKERVMNNKTFKSFLETVPEVRRLMESFYNSRFKDFLQSYSNLKNILLLDLFFAPHVEAMFNNIRTHAMMEYFQCYSSVSLAEIADEFCWTSTAELQEELIKLILADKLKARIDSINQVLNRETEDPLMETAAVIQRELETMRRNIKFAMIRTNMARNNHIVRGGGGEQQSGSGALQSH